MYVRTPSTGGEGVSGGGGQGGGLGGFVSPSGSGSAATNPNGFVRQFMRMPRIFV
jgi:hypothetical protein